MITPWTGYARDLLHQMFDIEAEPLLEPWIQALCPHFTALTTDPELHQLAMECLRHQPPEPAQTNLVFCTVCALLEYFWSGHAALPCNQLSSYFENWLSMQPQVCAAALPTTMQMMQWLEHTPYILEINEKQCQSILEGTVVDIDSFFDAHASEQCPQKCALSNRPFFVRVRGGITTPRLFAIQAEMVQILRRRLQENAFDLPQISDETIQNIRIGEKQCQLHFAQVEAVRKALSNPLTVITGGPGTGKTSIIEKILEICVNHLGISPAKIQLSAPTGKAARRMAEAIQIEGIPTPQTLHRLLQLYPNGTSLYHANCPIQADFIIIDELSMLGFDLAVNMLRAISPQTRLILIGDPEQLPPVDSGNLLEALVSPSYETMTDLFADALQHVCVRLTQNYRVQSQDAKPENIFTIQNAVMTKGGGQQAFRCLVDKSPDSFLFKDFEFCSDITKTQAALDVWAAKIQKTWRAISPDSISKVLTRSYHIVDQRVAAEDEEQLYQVFQHLEKFRLLTPMNRSSFGASAFNRYLMHQLNLKTNGTPDLPVGCLVLLTQNSYQIQHFNGETGLIIQDSEHHKYVVFPTSDPDAQDRPGHKFDLFSLELVPQLIPAFAISVHKSQGSQYDHVLIILSPYPSPLFSANMLYTAISRAKFSAALVASPDILPSCLR